MSRMMVSTPASTIIASLPPQPFETQDEPPTDPQEDEREDHCGEVHHRDHLVSAGVGRTAESRGLGHCRWVYGGRGSRPSQEPVPNGQETLKTLQSFGQTVTAGKTPGRWKEGKPIPQRRPPRGRCQGDA